MFGLKNLADSIWNRLALESRKKLIELMLQNEEEIRNIFSDSADRIAEELTERSRKGTAYEYLQNINVHLQNEAALIEERLNELIDESFVISIEAGLHQSREAVLSVLNKAQIDWKPIERVFFRTNEAAVTEMKNRSVKGLKLSNRIWEKGAKARTAMGDIIQAAIAEGNHPYQVAEILRSYVREGAGTLVSQYPNMMKRLGSGLPDDLCYEALRLARTEMAAAYGEATKRGAALNPATEGIRWMLSNANVSCDVCKEHSEHDSGLGKGIYRVDELPRYPAHPNCLCVLVIVHIDMDDLVDRLIAWNRVPSSEPEIERWYQNVYKRGAI